MDHYYFRFGKYHIYWYYKKWNKILFAILYAMIIGLYAIPIGLFVGILTETRIKKDYTIPKPASTYSTFVRIISLVTNGNLSPNQRRALEQKSQLYFPKVSLSVLWFNYQDQLKFVQFSPYLIQQWKLYLSQYNYMLEDSIGCIIRSDNSNRNHSELIQYWNKTLELTIRLDDTKTQNSTIPQKYIDLAILGLEPQDYSMKEIKSAYVRKIKSLHPDLVDSEQSTELIQEVKAAYIRILTKQNENTIS